MSATPRLRSGYPSTPTTAPRRRTAQATETPGSAVSASSAASKSPSALPLAPENGTGHVVSRQPVVPLTVLDAPQQRLYAFGVYALLWGWKLYDWLQVVEDGDASWFLFLKWIFIDFAFLFGLPELRIPWLELSQLVVTACFASHVLFNYMLMFNVPLPWQSWILGLVKVMYDRELSLSEHNVKLSSILNNHSLIMGKQIINILPEGSALLNPEHIPFCLSSRLKAAAPLPIHFNATVPVEIEITRIDFESNKEETIVVPGREIAKIAKQIRERGADSAATGFQWQYQVKKPGVYRLAKVLDEYKLEVQRITKDTYVVPCPGAHIKTAESSQRCIHDLSDLSLEVFGTPPLRIKYRRIVNGQNADFHFQSLQPEGVTSPLLQAPAVAAGPGFADDFSWVRPSPVTVSLNESMTTSGEWQYLVEEVHDAFGNVVEYAEPDSDAAFDLPKGLSQTFSVKERPRVSMRGCDPRSPLKVARGRSARLPLNLSLSGDVDDTSYQLAWSFSPIDSLTDNGDHGKDASIGSHSAKNSHDGPRVSEPGLYTLKSVSSGACDGQVDEPSSCLLLNPLEPRLSIRSEPIPDKCAGNSIGLRVDLDLVGTPPFTVRYQVMTDDHVEDQAQRVTGLRSQLELIPRIAGRHKYRYVFKSIDDAVYSDVPLPTDLFLEQVVKPAASAAFSDSARSINTCLDSQYQVDVILSGDPPFSLEWEIIHDGKRKANQATGIQDNHFQIETPAFSKGGEYILALSSVQDKRDCRTFLQDQLKISVRRQRPRAGFGVVGSKASVKAVQSESPLYLPLRLQGEAPWTLSYRNLNESDEVLSKVVANANDHLTVKSSGIYQIVGVRDKQCPGIVDPSASTFQVDWLPRPQISLLETDSITLAQGSFVKKEVCEGDIDGFEVNLRGELFDPRSYDALLRPADPSMLGSKPFHVEYEIKHAPPQGSEASTRKSFDAALPKVAISMDTSRAGQYTYSFVGLADNLYDTDKNFQPLLVRQRVYSKPAAAFSKPGQSFKYCMEKQEHEESIPMTLSGVPPFFVEIEIKHQVGSPPDTYRIPAINSHSYSMPIPREHLRLGTQQLRVRRVRDARGCQQKYDFGGPAIQIQLFDAPSIFPEETREDVCIGERISYTLSGTPPFDITYEFNGRWNAKSQTTSFRRIAEKPGNFTITSISDKASECRAVTNLHKVIHPLPSVRISRGKQSRVDIHEGNEVDILFEFWGTPPFEFTYTRSSNAKKGERSEVLETRHDVSYEDSKVVKASQEGTYEVVAIKDKYCSFSTQKVGKAEARST